MSRRPSAESFLKKYSKVTNTGNSNKSNNKYFFREPISVFCKKQTIHITAILNIPVREPDNTTTIITHSPARITLPLISFEQ
ncbi:hypothetical protein F050043D4_50650 [Bacteroides thetaiotaomicron]